MKKLLLVAALVLFGGVRSAIAGPNLADLPSTAYITHGGLDWAWAGPISSVSWDLGGPGEFNTLYAPGLHAGWRFATEAEWAARPLASAFEVLADPAAAVEYWNSHFTHIDFGNGADGDVRSGFVSEGDGTSYWEMWYVRDSVAHGVPDSGSALMLLGLGLATVVAARRRLA